MEKELEHSSFLSNPEAKISRLNRERLFGIITHKLAAALFDHIDQHSISCPTSGAMRHLSGRLGDAT